MFFASVVDRIDAWLEPNGEGLMNAFSVADHDLGVKPMSDMEMGEIEAVIASYSPIVDTYQLAMQNVTVIGTNYTGIVKQSAHPAGRIKVSTGSVGGKKGGAEWRWYERRYGRRASVQRFHRHA